MEKIFFKLPVEEDYPPVSSESVWGEKLPSGSYRLMNIPFYTKEANFHDEILIKRGKSGENIFYKVCKGSGNSTIRIVFFDLVELEIARVLAAIDTLGCSWEGMSKKFYAVNIPKNVCLDSVIDFLNTEAEEGVLDFEYGLLRQ